MYKLLIVDDEYYIREGMKSKIEWQSYNVEVIGTAKNGVEAIQFVNEKNPDIILTDIRMKGIDGLSMIEQLNKQNFKGKFIIMSGFTLFEYAHKALEEGVCHYLVKPVQKEKLIEIVKKITSMMDESRTQTIDKKIHKNNILLKGILNGNYIDTEKQYFKDSYIYSICFEKPILYDIDVEKRITTAISAIDNRILVFFENSNEMLLLVQDNISINLIRMKILQITGEKMWIGKSDIFSVKEKFVLARKQAKQAVSYRIYSKGSDVFDYNEIIQKKIDRSEFLKEIDLIVEYVETFQNINVKAAIDYITRSLSNEYVLPQDSLWVYSSIAFSMGKICDKLGVEKDRDVDLVNESIAKMHSIRKIKEAVFELCIHTIENIKKERSNSAKVDAATIIKYIDLHCLDDDISLTEMSKVFYIDISYLSKIIKNATGKSFVKYITERRMEKAKGLLQNTEIAISDISERVGYTEANYFSQLFKKLVGISPSEYREKYRKLIS